jgi:glycosyltransferase involved in cell wall biosynthesis
MSEPFVSVLLPVYNAEPYVGMALESMLRQDYRKLEVIAIDDGSTDRSLDVLRRYQRADGRISIVSRENRGLIATLNEGLALARGDLVARIEFRTDRTEWSAGANGAAEKENDAHQENSHGCL